MVMCTNSHPGINIIIPICDPDKNISHQNISAILIQVKNDMSYQGGISKTLFNGIDPFGVGLF